MSYTNGSGQIDRASLPLMTKPFRFAVQATPSGTEQWLATARRAEELGFSSMLMPDGTQLLSPLPALAFAAGATSTLHIGTWVLASPLRPPRLAAWDAHTLSLLSGGRFELGIGTGRPEVVEQSVQLLGRPAPGSAERLALAAQTIDELRALDGERHTQVLMAASGPRARAMAAAKADIVTIATGPLASREEVGRLVADVRQAAGDRAGQIEFASPLFVVGDEVPAWMQRFLEADVAELVARDSLQILRGTPRQMADELQRRRDTVGTSYVSASAVFAEQLAPVVELLAGR
jgi:alkanesulfonate monooxygenase SsuD/methylene tetrahydromethanopterin reductase-like flavin-dependent oxidoreductase (luciferase family)